MGSNIYLMEWSGIQHLGGHYNIFTIASIE